jgi:hypothetical protein
MAAIEHDLRNPDVSYEATDISPRPVLLTGLGIVAITVISGLIVLGILAWDLRARAEQPSDVPSIARGVRVSPPEPRLQSSPRIDFENFRAQQLSALSASGWVDREKGIAHIPIEDAMRMIAERGLPPQQTPEDLKLTTPQSGTRLTGFEGRAPQEPK